MDVPRRSTAEHYQMLEDTRYWPAASLGESYKFHMAVKESSNRLGGLSSSVGFSTVRSPPQRFIQLLRHILTESDTELSPADELLSSVPVVDIPEDDSIPDGAHRLRNMSDVHPKASTPKTSRDSFRNLVRPAEEDRYSGMRTSRNIPDDIPQSSNIFLSSPRANKGHSQGRHRLTSGFANRMCVQQPSKLSRAPSLN